MRDLIFVGGIHGVGKTFFCKKISSSYNIPSYSASSLIYNKKGIDYSINKKVNDINDNQNALIDELNKLQIEHNSFLLEGHFCLLNKDGEITRIPEKTFFEIHPKGIIVLVNSIEEISSRLKKRGNKIYNKTFLDRFQKEEINYAKEISNKLNIPYFKYDETLPIIYLNEFLQSLLLIPPS